MYRLLYVCVYIPLTTGKKVAEIAYIFFCNNIFDVGILLILVTVQMFQKSG